MKTRSSSGVGQKVDLEFDVDSLRIRDLAEDDDDTNNYGTNKSTIYDSLKRSTSTSTVNEDADPAEGGTVGKIKAEADSTKLKQFLNNLGSE